MRRSIIRYRQIGRIDLEETLAAEVIDLLRDPLTGRTRYGELRKLCNQLFSNWVDAQRLPPEPRPYQPQREDLTPL